MGVKVYRFTFSAGSASRRSGWLLFDSDMERAFNRGKQAARDAFAHPHGFMIESDQNDRQLRKSWGVRWN